MKKIYSAALGILVFAGVFAFLPASTAFAAFNDGSLGIDCPTVMVLNYTANTQKSNLCWPTSVSANPGDYVNAIFYFHNTSAQTAHNVVLQLSPESASSTTSQTFSGSITSSDGGNVSGSGTVSISSPESLTYGTVQIFYDQSSTPSTTIANTDIFTSGLSIGDIPGYANCPSSDKYYCHQGWAFVSFKVGTTVVTPACTVSISANPTNVPSGNSSVITWSSSSGCTSVTVSGPNGFISNSLSGSQSTGPLTNTSTYTISGSGSSGSAQSQSATVSVSSVSPACVINSFLPSLSTIAYGTPATLSWSTSNCTSVTVSGQGITATSFPTSYTTTTSDLFSTQTYTLSAYGTNGYVAPQTTTVTVLPQTQECTITQFGPNGTVVTYGGYATLNWTTSSGCTSVTISGPGVLSSSQALNGQLSVGPITTTSLYTINASGPSGSATPQTITISTSVVQSTCTISSFYASPSQVSYGGSATLIWNTYGCTSVTISGTGLYNYNTQPVSGQMNIGAVYGLNTYTINAVGPSGSAVPQTITVSSSGQNNQQTIPDVTTYAATSVTENSAVLNGYVDDGGYNNGYPTYYFQYGTSAGAMYSQTPTQTLSSYSGNISGYPSNLLPNTTYYFRAVGQNSYGTNYGTTLSFVTSGPTQPTTTASVVTSVPTNVSSSSARLNGLVVASNSYGTVNAYFEYGTDLSMSQSTTPQPVATSTLMNYFDTIYTSPNTTYYFRAAATIDGTLYQGSTVSFTTPAAEQTNYTRTVYINNSTQTSGTGTGSKYVMLTITDQFQNVSPGDTIDYTVNYQNISTIPLSNAILDVELPNGVTFKRSTLGVLTTNNTVAVTLGTIPPNASGSLIVEGTADGVKAGDSLIATATLSFTLPSTAQDSAIAYAVNTVGSNNNAGFLAGLALFGTGFFPTTLLGWILLIGLILLVIELSRRVQKKKNTPIPAGHVYASAAPHSDNLAH